MGAFWFSQAFCGITLTPHNIPVIIPAGGGSFSFDAEVINTTSMNVTADIWTDVLLNNGHTIGPLILRRDIYLPSSTLVTRQATQNVPASAPWGGYRYIAKVGQHPTIFFASDTIDFVKMPGEGNPAHNLGWSVFGWDYDESPIANQQSQITNLAAAPNPFNASTALSFKLQAASNAKLAVYDVSGREVGVLAEGLYPAGVHQTVWDASSMASGVYFARLSAGDMTQTRKMLLVK